VLCSVTKAEIVDAIYQQTGRNLAEMEMEMPEIKTLGTFECSVKLVSRRCVTVCGWSTA
jgi:large subunit ribosomal protein L9